MPRQRRQPNPTTGPDGPEQVEEQPNPEQVAPIEESIIATAEAVGAAEPSAEHKAAAQMFGFPNVPPEPPKPKLCDRHAVLPANYIALVGLAPSNTTVRALVANKIGMLIPDELTDGEAILDWVERNYKPKTPVQSLNASTYGNPLPNPFVQAATLQPPAPPIASGMTLTVHYSGTESGRCSYTRDLAGRAPLTISNQKLQEIFDEDMTWPQFLDAFWEMVGECISNEDGYSRPYYIEEESCDDHDGANSETEEECVRDRDRAQVLAEQWVRYHHPDTADNWGIR